MNLSEKIKHLRSVEGELRGLGRPMTQMEVVKAMQEELNDSISQAYLSQIESGKRVHLTQASRDLLARFFNVHPGYLVNDPPDFSTDLLTDVADETDRLETWLLASAAEWQADPVVSTFFQRLADSEDPRRFLEVLEHFMHLSVAELEAILQIIKPGSVGERT